MAPSTLRQRVLRRRFQEPARLEIVEQGAPAGVEFGGKFADGVEVVAVRVPATVVAQRDFDERDAPLEAPREGGELYVREWLRVLKARPRFVTIADWNNFEEETAIEDSYAWEDRWGHAVPDLYRRITWAYSRLRAALAVAEGQVAKTRSGGEGSPVALAGALVKGEYYRAETRPEVYLFDGKRLVYSAAMPRRAATILVPDEIFERLKRASERT